MRASEHFWSARGAKPLWKKIPQKPSRRNFLVFRLVATFALFFALFKFIPYDKLIEIYGSSKKIYILFAFLVFFLCTFLGAIRWRFLLISLGLRISLREVLYSYFSGLFFNFFCPSFVAGDVFRGVGISKRHGEAKKVAASILMDRLSGAFALVLVAIFSFIVGKGLFHTNHVFFSLILLCVIVGFTFLLIFSKTFFRFSIGILKKSSSLRGKLVSFHDQLYFFKNNSKVFIKNILFFSLPIQILVPFSFFLCSKAFGVETGIISFLILVPIITAIALIPLTIAGAGTREAASVYFFSLVGIEKSIGLGISLLNFAFLIFIGILGGILYVSVYHRWLQSRS
ncbi:MAG: lysylphosphatidylglycerol synthase transmembrane domain-containing protein [Candidatus Omnitrophota bacterium]